MLVNYTMLKSDSDAIQATLGTSLASLGTSYSPSASDCSPTSPCGRHVSAFLSCRPGFRAQISTYSPDVGVIKGLQPPLLVSCQTPRGSSVVGWGARDAKNATFAVAPNVFTEWELLCRVSLPACY